MRSLFVLFVLLCHHSIAECQELHPPALLGKRLTLSLSHPSLISKARPSSFGRTRQANEVPPDNLALVSGVIGGTMAGLMLVPLTGNIYALASGKHQRTWGAIGLFGVGFLGCMVGYIAGTSGFFPHKTYWYATLPMWGLGLGAAALSIANLALAPRKAKSAQVAGKLLVETSVH